MSKDVKNLPHYTAFKMQPIEFFMANIGVMDFLQMCAIKYICRYKMKNGIEDLNKAQQYIDYMKMQWYKEHPEKTEVDPRELHKTLDIERGIPRQPSMDDHRCLDCAYDNPHHNKQNCSR